MTERRKVALIGCTGALLRESPGHSVEIVLSFTNREAAEEALDFLAGDEPRRTVEQAQREAENSVDDGIDDEAIARKEDARIREEKAQATALREKAVAADLRRQNDEEKKDEADNNG